MHKFSCQFTSISIVVNPCSNDKRPQIHEYILSKAPPVPQVSSSEGAEEHHTKSESEVQASLHNSGAINSSEELQNPPEGDIIVEEEQEVPANVHSSSAEVRAPREAPYNGSSDQVQQKPEARVPKAADDRLFTWAAVGLTIAIVVLLLKKFLKSTGHGALFTDGS